MLKLLSLSLSLLLLIFTLYPSPAYAQDSTPSAIPVPATVSPTSPLYTDLIVNNMFHTFSCLMIGGSLIGQPCLTYQVTKNAQGTIQSIPVLSQVNLSGGLLGTTTGLIGALYLNPPLRTGDYLGSLGQQLGIVKTAHAQVIGSGNEVLKPILALWQVSRNISYIAMIVVFVIIGLMVLFRQRINPQTVITAQAALPGLVVGLILITFSYFMAALISDTAFIGTNIVGYYFGAARGDTSQNLLEDLDATYANYRPDPGGRKSNLISIFSKFATVADHDKVTAVVSSFWDDINVDAQRLLATLAAFIAVQLTGQTFEVFKIIPRAGEGIIAALQGLAVVNTLTGPFGPTAVVGALLGLVVTAILLYAMFKLLIRLTSCYLHIIFLTITGPFQFLAAALPGRQSIATGWILNMLANVLAFPAVIAVFYFVAFILGPSNGPYGPFKISDTGTMTGNNLTPVVSAQTSRTPTQITSTDTFPLFGGMNLDFITLLLAFGALLALPSIPDIIARTIGRVGVAGQLIGQELSGGVNQGRGYGQQFQQGAGGASGRLAGLRGAFDTPGHVMDQSGNIVESYAAGSGGQVGFLRRWGVRKGLPASRTIANKDGV